MNASPDTRGGAPARGEVGLTAAPGSARWRRLGRLRLSLPAGSPWGDPSRADAAVPEPGRLERPDGRVGPAVPYGGDVAEIRFQMEETRRRLRDSIAGLEDALRGRLDPRERYRASPAPVLAAALVAALWLGWRHGQRALGPPGGPLPSPLPSRRRLA